MGSRILTSIHSNNKFGLSRHDDLIVRRRNGEIYGASNTVTIASASLLTLNTTPVEIIPAPGAGLAIILRRLICRLTAGTAYSGIAAGEDLVAKYTNGSGAQVSSVIETTGFLDQATAQIRYAYPPATSGSTAGDVTPVANANVVLALLSGDITTGTGDLIVKAWYDVINTTFTD